MIQFPKDRKQGLWFQLKSTRLESEKHKIYIPQYNDVVKEKGTGK